MTDFKRGSAKCRIQQKNILLLKQLRLSLRYRPEIFKLILKMRQTIKAKKVLVNKLKQRLNMYLQKSDEKTCRDTSSTTESIDEGEKYLENIDNSHKQEMKTGDKISTTSMKSTKTSSCQTCDALFNEAVENFINTERKQLYKIKKEKMDPSCRNDNDQTKNVAVSEGVVEEENTVINRGNSTVGNKCIEPSKDASVANLMQVDDSVLKKKESSCQTDESSFSKTLIENIDPKNEDESNVWNITKNDGEEKSIAEQVKEVAQNALQESGMVYVESAGMYYDYKTGYYYNSELGLYYHTNTGCYYYYSNEKKSFVFHSYPDRSAMSGIAQEIAHRKRAKKHKKDTEVTSEESKPKRRKKSSKKKLKKDKDSSDIVEKEKNESNEKELENVDQSLVKNDVTSDAKFPSDMDTNGKQKIEVAKEEMSDVKEADAVMCDKSDSKPEELEDGECSETASENSDVEDSVSTCSTESTSDDDSVAKHHPPCMRIIVRESIIPKLKVGSLFLVTKDGGTLGREGEQHTIIIKDSSVSRNHLDIRYDLDKKIYVITDLGSKNGTVLNGMRLSETQTVSRPVEVVHGSTIQLGETKLLCHIHPGNDTCGHCEPGLIMETQDMEKKVAYTRTCNVKKQHELELARLKNLYAPQLLMIEDGAYNDRAKARRETVGSSHNSEKTRASNLETSIEPENKGFKLLEKMGWSKGEGLGKDNQGETEPIPMVSYKDKAGLGTAGAVTKPGPVPFIKPKTNLGPMRLASSTKMLQPPAKVFQNALEDDDDADIKE